MNELKVKGKTWAEARTTAKNAMWKQMEGNGGNLMLLVGWCTVLYLCCSAYMVCFCNMYEFLEELKLMSNL